MTQDATELNALIGSRICHDLISPLGAIGNGVELLSMAGISSAPEMTLISESVENANARIRFFRIAFGAASRDAMIGQNEVSRVLSDLYRGNRVRVDWRINEDTLRCETKLCFLIIQCFESAMPWGGKISVTQTGKTWNVYGTADRLKVDDLLWDLLVNPSTEVEVNAANVHFALAPPTAQSYGKSIRTAINGKSISVSF
ncbi:MAG: histidine phosphotransferase family protein [Pseudomonadota bacterium]